MLPRPNRSHLGSRGLRLQSSPSVAAPRSHHVAAWVDAGNHLLLAAAGSGQGAGCGRDPGMGGGPRFVGDGEPVGMRGEKEVLPVMVAWDGGGTELGDDMRAPGLVVLGMGTPVPVSRNSLCVGRVACLPEHRVVGPQFPAQRLHQRSRHLVVEPFPCAFAACSSERWSRSVRGAHRTRVRCGNPLIAIPPGTCAPGLLGVLRMADKLKAASCTLPRMPRAIGVLCCGVSGGDLSAILAPVGGAYGE